MVAADKLPNRKKRVTSDEPLPIPFHAAALSFTSSGARRRPSL